MKISLAVTAALCAMLSSSAAAVDVAVFPAAGNLDADTRLVMTKALRSEARAIGLDVLSAQLTDGTIDTMADLAEACTITTDGCAAQLGGLMGVKRVVVAVVASDVILVREIDVASASESGRVSVPFVRGAPTSTIRLALVRLLRPDLEQGQLFVDVDIAGASIVIDGTPAGVSPLGPVGVKPGRHEVYVAHVDHESQTLFVDVELGQAATVEVVFAGPRTTTVRRNTGGGASIDFMRVFVMPAQVTGFDPLAEPLVTMALVEELQKLDSLIVVPPKEFIRAMTPAQQRLVRSCGEGASCIAAVLEDTLTDGEIVVVRAGLAGRGAALVGTAVSFSDKSARDAQVPVVVTKNGQGIATGMTRVVRGLYPERGIRAGLSWGPSPELMARFDPPPLPVWSLYAGGAVVGVGAAVATIGAVGFLDPQNSDDPTPALLLAGGGVVAGAALAATIIATPFIDWYDADEKNAELEASLGIVRARADGDTAR
jgi:hypothetical protein